MNCQKFEETVSELARGQMMEAELRITALRHAGDCSKCKQRLLDEQALTRGLRALAGQMHSLNASSAVELRLHEAMSERNVPTMLPSGVVKRRRGVWVAVAAAVLLLVGSVIAFNWQGRQTAGEEQYSVRPTKAHEPVKPGEEEKNEEQKKAKQPPDRERMQVVEHKSSKPRGMHTRSRTIKSEPAVVANHAGEIATDFIPLGYVNSANFQEGGQIVRVELPRSALVSFGLPVNMDRLNEKVKADVWLGVDGMAHAIRFVQ